MIELQCPLKLIYSLIYQPSRAFGHFEPTFHFAYMVCNDNNDHNTDYVDNDGYAIVLPYVEVSFIVFN